MIINNQIIIMEEGAQKVKFDKEKFWKNIYETVKDDDDLTNRNSRYRASVRLNIEPEKADTVTYKPDFRDGINEKTEPDDFDRWEGLIAPDGKFFSCDFGGHEVKAMHIMKNFFPHTETGRSCLDTLIGKLGWCATRCISINDGHYITIPLDLGSEKRITKAQKETVWNAAIKNGLAADATKAFAEKLT